MSGFPNVWDMSVDELQEELARWSEKEHLTNWQAGRIGELERELEERSDVYWAKKGIARD